MSQRWMVRSASNFLSGPFSSEEIVKKMDQGELQLEDEVCPAGGYWFSMFEDREVMKFFGRVFSKGAELEDEKTISISLDDRTGIVDLSQAQSATPVPLKPVKNENTALGPFLERFIVFMPLLVAVLFLLVLRVLIK